jgi:hypothetical protein
MTTAKNKTRAIAIAIILLLSPMVISLSILPVNAHTPGWNIPTNAFMSIAPNPAGVGQTVTVDAWLIPFSPTANGIYGDDWSYIITVTNPSGTVTSLGTFRSNPTAWIYTTYTPNTVGNYTFDMYFDGYTLVGANPPPVPSAYSTSPYIGDYYEPSNTSATLVVQQQPITSLPQTPLPTGYWQNPIYSENQLWYTISGNWLYGSYNQSSNFNPYTTAPQSAHIVWTKPLMFGGLIGGSYGGSELSNYYTDKLYESAFTPPIIINGVLYYNPGEAARYGFYAVNLRTGQQLWYQNSTGPVQFGGETTAHIGAGTGAASTNIPWTYPIIKYGQIYNYYTPNQEGGLPYLWEVYTANSATTYNYTTTTGTTYSFSAPAGSNVWEMLDASTGNYICSIANVPGVPVAAPGTSAVVTYGDDGSILIYVLNDITNQLSLWNSSLALSYPNNNMGVLTAGEAFYWMWRPPLGQTVNGNNGYEWTVNVTTYTGEAGTAEVISAIGSNVVLCITGSNSVPESYQMEQAFNATTGAQLWVQNRTEPAGETNYAMMSEITNGVFAEYHEGAEEWDSYSATTGQQIWGPSTPDTNPWGTEPSTPPKYETNAYGDIIQMCADGIHAINLTSGQREWDFYAPSSGFETGTPTYPFIQSALVVGGNTVFAASSIPYGDPVYRGAQLYAINAATGQQIWSVDGFFTSGMALADGYLVGFNGYDNQIYCFGKGQTATTVTATPGVGNIVTVQGTVTDQSPGQTCLGIPAAGTPAISDASMSAWMEYLYMQQPEPLNATGVPVTLTATNTLGQTVSIGTVTSDITGHYSTEWTPPSADVWTITASFTGTNSYYASSSETGIAVSSAASDAVSPSSGVPTAAYIGIAAAAVIIVAAAVLLALRRRR